MKTSATEIMKRKGKFSVLIMFGAFLLHLTGCQKEELTTTSANIITTTNQERTFPVVRYDPLPMIFIDHHAFRSVSPDYSVAIFASGDVTFNGHNFTYVIGEKKFHVSMGTIQELR